MMTPSDYIAIGTGCVGALAGLGALITAISKKKVDTASFTETIASTYRGLLETVRTEMDEQKEYFEKKIRNLEEIIKKKDDFIQDVRCDKLNCPNRIPPKN